MLYNSTPQNTGGFIPPSSGFSGYYNLSLGIPFYHGRSLIASIPEYTRNPGLLANDLVRNISEGRSNLMKLLYEEAERNGTSYQPDVKFRYRVNVTPNERIYLAEGTYTVSDMKSTFKLSNFSRPTQSYPTATGNPKVVGDIARVQEGDYLLLMFSWLDKDRTGTPQYGTSTYSKVVPEIVKVISRDVTTNTIVVQRNWAGQRRVTSPQTPPTLTVVSNSSTPAANQVRAKDAFFMRLPNSMPEDQIDQKIYNFTQTWAEGIMQRMVRAWGSGRMGEIINQNLGNPSPLARSKQQAIADFYDQWELAALWGERAEGFTEEGEWWGLTDGLLTDVPKSHYVGIVPITYQNIRSRPEKAFGSFDIPIFNLILERAAYIGSENKIMLCGNDVYRDFTTMINYMTQAVPDIKSEWKIVGKRFTTSNGLTIDFVPSDKMSLNGMSNKAILFDRSAFKKVELKGYPTDIVEINNENPLKSNGFIHGVMAFVNTNPDATWVFTSDPNLAKATYASYKDYIIGVEHP